MKKFEFNFRALPAIWGAWKVAKSTLRVKKCCVRYQDHQNRTIGARFSPRSIKIALLYSPDGKLFGFWPIFDHWTTFYVPGNHSIQQGIHKNIMLGTKIIKIGPLGPYLALRMSKQCYFDILRSKSGTSGPILMILVPNITFFSIPCWFERFPGTWKVNHWSEMGQKPKSLLLRL